MWIGTPICVVGAEVGIDDGRDHVVRDHLRVRERLVHRDDRLDRVVVREELGDERRRGPTP